MAARSAYSNLIGVQSPLYYVYVFTFVSEPAEQYRDVKQVKQKTAYRIRCGLLGRVESSHVTHINSLT